MKKVGSYEAKTHLPRMLDEVAEKGENYLITKNGKPVAKLAPVESAVRRNPKEVVDEILALKTGGDCSDISLGEVKNAMQEGRR